MTTAAPLRIWLETSHHAAFRVGGWAFVRADGAATTGLAGGDRRVDADALALAGLLAALKDVGEGRSARVFTASPAVRAIPGRIAAAEAGGEAPAENLALWGQAAAALKRTRAEVVPCPAAEKASAFAASWSEVAREKAKTGAFSSAIPKPNLAKLGLS